jgi:hypothetical protein
MNICVHYWKNFKIELLFFHLEFLKIKYKYKKWCLKWNKVNIMHTIISSQQMWWLGGKGVDLHPEGSRINSHKWHGLQSIVGCWSNIPYLHNQHKVIRMDVMCPFCIKHHIDVGPNGLVSFVRMETLKFSFSLDFSFKHMGIKNKFGHRNNNNWKNWSLNMQ